MGTRGAFGFRIGGQDKLTYNHGDSYPTGLGVEVARFVNETSKEELAEVAKRVTLVDNSIKPTASQIEECRPWTDLSVASHDPSDWYCLLREAQGNLFAFKDGLSCMLKGNKFVLDSLFCEWAYVIDVDLDEVQVFTGFQKTLGNGPYNREYAINPRTKESTGYTGVSLVTSIPCEVLRNLDATERSDVLYHVEKLGDILKYGEQDDEFSAESCLNELQVLYAKAAQLKSAADVKEQAPTGERIVRICLVDDETTEIYVGDLLIHTLNHDDDGWHGMERGERLVRELAGALGVKVEMEG